MRIAKALQAVLLLLSLVVLFSDTTVAQESKAWSIVATYQIPNDASGLAWDGTYLYCGIYGSNGSNIYRINPTNGSYTLQCTGPQEDTYGLTFDGTNLVTTDHPSNPAKAIKFTLAGALVSQFNLPAQYVSGIAYDAGNYWVSRYYPDPSVIYKVDGTGAVLRQFTAPDNQPWDLCLQNEFLWMADYWGDKLYKIDTTTGLSVESHASEGVDPAGIVWDGQYLWYCDEGGSSSYDRLYKVDLLGIGTPVITIPVTTYDYANVVINTSSTWNCVVSNTGTANLVLNSISFSGSPYLTCGATFPITIPPSTQTTLPIVYAPTATGPLSATAQVSSNDPIHPTSTLTLNGYCVNSGPDIYVAASTHDYGSIRLSANKRWYLTIQNMGSNALMITGITSSDPRFTVDEGTAFPFYISPVDSAKVGIWFWPRTPESFAGTLSIASNDPDENPYVVSVSGSAEKLQYPIGDTLWSYLFSGGFDNSPKAIAPIGDINGDGVSDVIVCTEDYYVRAVNGNSDGGADILWEHEVYAASVYQQSGIAISPDINDDGFQEVVIGTAWGGCYVRMINGKTGQTIWTHDSHEYGSGGWIYQVDCSHDYNGDGILDVLAASGDDGNGTGPKRAYCLNGTNGASLWECPLGGAVFSVIGVEDFTGDGKPDAVAGASNADETVGRAVGINGATGGIFWSKPVPGSSVWALAQLDDINSDGFKDVAVGDFSQTTGSVFGCNAINGATLWTASGFGSILRIQRMNDLNGDGKADIVPSHWGLFAAAINGQTGALIWSHNLADKSWHVARANDVTGDGINDVLVATLYQSNFCYFLDGTSGAEAKAIPFAEPVDAMTSIPDVVGDNSWEMVAGGRYGQLFCFSGGIDGVANHSPLMPSNPHPAQAATNQPTSVTMSWTGGDPDVGDLVTYDVYFGTTTTPPLMSSGQTNTTYHPSALLSENTQYNWRIIAHDNNGGLTVGELWWFRTAGSYVPGDANNDGTVDISDAVYLIAYIFTGGPAPIPLAAGDANCDGTVDISDAVYLIAYIFTGGPAPCAK
jgi:hypothetical protein